MGLLRFFPLLFLLLLIPGPTRAQFGNEWINFNQEYYKITVSKDSIYRLDYDDLLSAGFPVSSVDPRKLQLYHRGIEQAIYVAGENDAVFNSGDYIEFYGRKNDGTLDTDLYVEPELQPHSYYHLYSDKAAYFLTYDPLPVLGKRMESFFENNTTNIPKETYLIDEKLMVLTNEYAIGNTVNSYIQVSGFDSGEGWTGQEIRNGGSRDYTITGIVNGVTGGGALPQLEMVLIGRNGVAHVAEISVGSSTSSLRLLTTQNFSGFNKHTVTQDIAWSDISGAGNLVVRVRTPDRVSVSYIKVRYPQATNANSATEKVFELRANGSGKSYIEMSNAVAGSLLYDITDPNEVVRIGTTSASTLNAVVPNTLSSRKLILFTPGSTSSAPIEKVTFTQVNPSAYNYVLVSHPSLMQPALGYSNVVQAYADYRASAAGGAYQPLVIDIHELYNQFNYGEISPRAIRQFMKYMINTSTPKYLLLIGKGLEVNYGYHRSPSSFTTYKDLVPTAGLPGSDIQFTAGLAGTTYEPAVPTGRISAISPVQVGAYLNKVKEMEAMPFNDLWRKKILHLSGGGNAQELQFFRLYLEGFQSEAEQHFLGGRVMSVAKQSTDLEFINISEQINSGLNLVTFFGHSAPLATDIEIGFVTNSTLGYDNPGKYPMFLVNGCSAGTFFSTFEVFGEDWINASNKGAIGFLAHSSYGLAPTLRRYSELFYQYAYGDSAYIKKGVGDVQKEICREYMASASATEYNIAQIQQMVLLGDPAVSVFGARKPDYELNENNIYTESFDGGPITALSDSFALNFIVRNFGITNTDTVRISVTRKFNDNTEIVYDSLYPSVLYQDTLVFILKKERVSGYGNNTFTITIDSDSIVSELSESNNSASFEMFVPLSATKNLYPHDFAIVSQRQVDLSFQCTDLLSGEREFHLEMDTVDTFDSPFKKTFTVTGTVLARQQAELISEDSLTYYWRTRLAVPAPGESEEWYTTSFTYIDEGPAGWAQMHFPQYMKNETVGLVRDLPLRKLAFDESSVNIFIKNPGSGSSAETSVKLNGAEFQTNVQPCRNNTINLIAFDKSTSVPYNGFSIAGPITCGRAPQVIMSYASNAETVSVGTSIYHYLESVAQGDPVILFSIKNVVFSALPDSVKERLGDIGISAAQIDGLTDGYPVTIIGRKGDAPGTATVFMGSSASDELVTDVTLTGYYTSGTMYTPYIGPASHWQALIPKPGVSEPEDEVLISVTGINLQGEEVLLMDSITGNENLTSIDAEAYPYLRLSYSVTDELHLTPVQLNKWIVLYTPVPEGILLSINNPDHVAVDEGTVVEMKYGFTNISDQLFPDSIPVLIDVFNKKARISEKKEFNIKGPLPGDTTVFSFSIETLGKSGFNDLDIFVNRRVLPEQYYDNNVMERYDYIEVQSDIFKPVIDVTVDGRHLLNGDYVSPNPEIDILVWDESRFIRKTDTTGINLFLKFPCDTCAFERIDFTRADVAWHPATDTSEFLIHFTPEDLYPGIYHLMIEVQDASGNVADDVPYQVTFEVSDEAAVTMLAPFPNPSGGAIYFMLVISGDQVPAELELSIVNMNGKTVHVQHWRDIHIGTNTFGWDGRNAQGPLPGGLYIYRLILRDENGNEINISTSNGQSFFKGGYGKLILVR